MEKRRSIELLAPAKDLECGLAAINCGADAVYIGGPRFGAREAASNSVNDIEKLARYARLFNARVYVTLNTILFDHETDDAMLLAHSLYNAGVDALIIQDMAFLEMDLPPIQLHASTQTHNYEIEKIKLLSNAGFSRIVLARELSLDQIREIRKVTSSELEFFIHGSLCVSLSGQCYLSYAIGGRSANRGVCAQPCRRKYTLTNDNGNVLISDKHLLSLKDLNLSDSVEELTEAGIDSFKIEGRLKDATYVKNITAFYRMKLDRVIEDNKSLIKSSEGKTIVQFDPDPAKSFNRGATDYFIHGRNNKITSIDTPKSLGEELGIVTNVTNNWFEISSEKVVANNDGLVYLNRKKGAVGIKVNRVDGKKIFPDSMNNIFPGATVFRNYDHQFNLKLSQEVSLRKLEVTIKLMPISGGIKVIARTESGIEAEIFEPIELSVAQNIAKSFDSIRSQMAKTGGTPFEVKDVDAGGCENYFFPASAINNMRRKILDELTFTLENWKRTPEKPKPVDALFPQLSTGFEANVSNILARKFYKRYGVNLSGSALEVSGETAGKRVMTTKHCLKYMTGFCTRYGANTTTNPPLYMYLTDGDVRLRLEFNCKDCFMNVFFDKE
jgi:23S rRNA 5-hydroxycytidine C2501 synthase